MRADQRRIRNLILLYTLLAAIVIAAVFVIDTVAGRRSGAPEPPSKPAFGDSSEIQAEINGLDWIVPMPLTINEFSRPGTPLDKVNGIVIHYIGNPGTTAEQNRNFFENLAVHQNSSVSSNFIVDLDGTIVQCIPVDEVAYASGFRNEDTLSIEVCHPDETGKFNNETYLSVVRLTAWLCDRFNLTDGDILRHYDVSSTGKECPLYFVENESAWETLRADVRAAMDAMSNPSWPGSG